MDHGRKMLVPASSWHRIPWNRSCDECVHFVAAPANQQGQQALLEAVWNHFHMVHHVKLTPDGRDHD